MPHRLYKRFWHRFLHDNTGDEIARVVGQLPHANVTMVPYHMGSGSAVPVVDAADDDAGRRLTDRRLSGVSRRIERDRGAERVGRRARHGPVVPIGDVQWRTHARIKGRIRSLRVQPWANVATLECVVVDETGGLLLVFLGRRRVAGVELGRYVMAEGMVGNQRGYLAMLNPEIQLLVAP